MRLPLIAYLIVTEILQSFPSLNPGDDDSVAERKKQAANTDTASAEKDKTSRRLSAAFLKGWTLAEAKAQA